MRFGAALATLHEAIWAALGERRCKSQLRLTSLTTEYPLHALGCLIAPWDFLHRLGTGSLAGIWAALGDRRCNLR
jgi:hypothetical protein